MHVIIINENPRNIGVSAFISVISKINHRPCNGYITWNRACVQVGNQTMVTLDARTAYDFV